MKIVILHKKEDRTVCSLQKQKQLKQNYKKRVKMHG